MAYASISTWTTEAYKNDPAARAANYATLQEKYVPMSLSMGATQTFAVEVDDQTTAIVSLWPDKATRQAAAEKIAAMRGQASDEFSSRMTLELVGEVRASG